MAEKKLPLKKRGTKTATAPIKKKMAVKASSNGDHTETKYHYIIGIGASAGGLEALEKFFTAMPPDSGFSFVVVQHLSPDYKSLMVEILTKYTRMRVIHARDGMLVQPDHVYLMPRKKNMTIFHKKLFLTDQDHNHANINLPIDHFLKSLAEDQQEKAVGIILSGTGSDGSRGIRMIKEAGGIVIVQSRESAKFDGMPLSAITTGIVDYILTPEQIPDTLLKHIKHPHSIKIEDVNNKTSSEEDNLTKILSVIRNETGIDFTFYKPSTIVRRIEHRMSINQLGDLKYYLRHLYNTPNEVKNLAKELLIGVTQFFRDQPAFELIETKVIPQIFKNQTIKKTFRVWSVGCSTGEEAYSLAILFKEYLEKNDLKDLEIKIFATDIDKKALEYASTGIYSESMSADISKERLRKYFVKKGDTYQVTREIREMVIFAPHNIAKDPPFSKIDLISCRNLLIYFQARLQKKVFSTFSFSLNTGGFLFLGPSESLNEFSEAFKSMDIKWKIYEYKGTSKTAIISERISTDFVKNNRDKILQAPSNHDRTINKPVNEDKILGKAFETMLDNYNLSSVVITESADLIHVYGDINNYLKIPKGKVQLNLLKMVDKELNIALGTAVHRAFRDLDKVVYRNVDVRVDGKAKKINLVINPFMDHDRKEKLAMVTFEEITNLPDEQLETPNFDLQTESSQLIADLEYELQFTKENLRATVEELETSNEELQATNEELLASNEELQSTNEELQSVNEELITVNSEYQSKIGELTELNNDMNSLYSSTDIGTIFLDLDLCIRKFTSGIKKEINIITHDIGRPLEHISHNLKYNDLIKDSESVLESHHSIEREVQGKNDNWYLLRIQPYRTTDNVIKGVVILLIDITKLKKIDIQLKDETAQRLKLYQESVILQNISDAVISFDTNFKILSWNKGAERIYGWKQEDVTGHNLNKVLNSEFTGLNQEKYVKQYLKNGYWLGEIVQERSDGNKLIILSLSTVNRNGKEEKFQGLVVNRDITSNKFITKYKKEEHDAITYFENSKSLFIVVGNDYKVKYINNQACQLLHYEKKEIINKNWLHTIISKSSRTVVKNIFDSIFSGESENFNNLEYPVQNKNSQEKLIKWKSYALRDAAGTIVGVLSEGKIKS
jgi:two-component system CheB/CheR fusion protein